MSNYNLISVDTILAKLFRENIIKDNYNESDIIEMIGEALEAIGAFKQYEQDVKFLTVKDHKAMLPEGLQEIIMVAYNLNTKNTSTSCDDECNINDSCLSHCEEENSDTCWSCHNKYYIPDQRYYDLVKDYNTIFSKFTANFYSNYLPLKLAVSPFSITNILHCENCINITCNSEEEYIIKDGMIQTSFQEGNICIAFLKTPTDKDGYPMIPDLYEYQQAITSYIMMLSAKSDYFNDPTQNNRVRYRELESDWQWYCRQSKNKQLMPSNIDERENLYRGNMKLVKNYNGYYNFFGNLNNLERFNLNGRERRKKYRY